MLKFTRPAPESPEGFTFMSLEEENDLEKINRVLYRGLDHPGDPPVEEIELRRKMQSCPRFRFDLNVVAKKPSGEHASYCISCHKRMRTNVSPVAEAS